MTAFVVIIEILGLAVLLLVAVAAVGFVCLRQYYLARRKGYSPILAGAVVGGALVAMLAFALVASALVDDRDWPNATKNAFVFLVLAVIPPLVVAGLVRALPSRSARRAGARSSRFLWSNTARRLEQGLYWGAGLIVATGAVGFWSFPDPGIAGKMIGFGVSLLAVPPLFAYYRKRATAPGLKTVVSADARPPVLYLRAFYQESEAFTWGPKEEMACYTDQPITAQTWYTIGVTFEQYLGSVISQEIGPFVALGNPEDVLAPEGAARDYAEDRDWQQEFLTLAETAAAIVMEVSKSDNLRWEIGALSTHGWQPKLFVITAPVPKSDRAIYRWLYGALRAAKAIPRPHWSEFASEFNNAGFRVDPADPGSGSVVSFDPSGSSEVVIRGASDPAEFVTAMRRRLQALPSTHGSEQGSNSMMPR